MLIRYKSGYEKTAMGMLSLMASEKDIGKLRQTIKLYQQDSAYKLYLWKEMEDVIGLIGLREEEECITILHLSVTPSHRMQGIATMMINELLKLYPSVAFKGNAYTSDFLDKIVSDRIIHV
ncbi:MAG: GNAT family N-acetyltransferase [Bacillaceae bacterium]